MGRARRIAVVTLVAVLVGGALLAALPASLVAVRVLGIALSWWFWAVALAAVALAGTAAAVCPLRKARDGAPAASDAGRADSGDLLRWASPALLIGIGALVFAGAPEAPFVAIAALAAPLLGRLLPGGTAPPALVERVAIPVAAALVLAAQLLVAGDLALALGWHRGQGLALALLLLVACTPVSRGRRLRGAMAAAGALAVAAGVSLVWAHAATSPWGAWTQVVARPLLAFSEQAAAVTRGVDVRAPGTLAFGEAQQVTALTGGVYRVIERDGVRPVMREWRLAAGESLAVRMGDELTLTPGTRLRFEAGKRVPGAPASGAAWGQPRERFSLWSLGTFLGAALTLVGLCAGGTGPGRRSDVLALGGGLLLVAAAVLWGVYAALAGADVALGGPPGGSLVQAARVLVPSAAGGPALLLLVGCAVLMATVALALRQHVGQATPGERGGPVWIGVAAAAAIVAGLRVLDPWSALALGAGLAASVLVAPRLLVAPRARAVARATGAVAFAASALAAGPLGHGESVVAAYPALVAVPLAWAAGWLLDRPAAALPGAGPGATILRHHGQ